MSNPDQSPATLLARIAELEAELDDMEAERDEALRGPWPEWAEKVLKIIRRYSNCEGAEEVGEGIDLPAELEAMIEHWPRPTEAAAMAAFADDDKVLVPRGLLGAACNAIDKKRDAPRTLGELRRYTTGDLSAAAMAATVPAGWKLVPIEPTAEMVAAGMDVGTPYGDQGRKDVWSNMVKAAPQAPVAGQPAEPSPADKG